jgi:Trypsin-like peptidase domain
MRAAALAAGALTIGAAAGPAASGASGAVVARSAGAGAVRYWTPERIAKARPLTAVRGAPGPALRRAPQPPPFESFQVPDPLVPPLPTHGKVFGFLRGFGGYECSATVVGSAARTVVMTAGHCVYDPRSGTAASRILFIPAYADGSRPFGAWTAGDAHTTRPWIRQENYDFDYATLTMRRHNGQLIEDVVGARPLAVDTPREQTYNAYGYPANFARAQRMWTCRGPYAGDDPRPIPGGPAPIGMGCDMKSGASGGGWIDDLGQLVSVSSFGYGARKGFLYGPYLTPRAARLVARSG